MAALLGVAYFASLAAILLWPSPVDRPIDGALMDTISWLAARGLPEWLISYQTVEFVANIALFVPFGAILALRLPRRRWWLAVVIAAVVSAAVELAQGLLLSERVPAASDIAANTAGALLGCLVIMWIWALRRRSYAEDQLV